MGPRHDLSFCACKTAWLAPELLISMGPIRHLWFLDAKGDFWTQNNKSLWVPDMICRFVYKKTAWVAPEKLVSTGPSPHLWFLHAKQRLLDLELQVSMGPRPLLSFCACKTAWLLPEILVSMGPSPHLWFSACKTACLASELLVSMSPSPHVWFMDTKQRLLDRINKSLWVPHITCSLGMQNGVLSIRITSLYGSQPSSVVFACKTAAFVSAYKSLWVPHLTCRCVHVKQRD